MRAQRTLLLAVALAALTTSGCTMWKVESAPLPTLIADGERGTLRITRSDNSVVILNQPTIVNDSIVGSTDADPPQRAAIPLADVIFVQTRHRSFEKTVEGVGTTAQVIIGAAYLSVILLIYRIL
ncbi:MAG: hypothetical protein ABI311_13840 [Gemmatimonadaceae bacterium]